MMLSQDILEANQSVESNQAMETVNPLIGDSETQEVEYVNRTDSEDNQTDQDLSDKGGETEEELEAITINCCISLEEVPITQCLVCASGHAISNQMLEPFVNSEFGKDFDTLKANAGCLKCPFDGCEEHFQPEDLEMIVSPEVFGKVLKMKQRFDEHTEYVQSLEDGQEDLEACVREQFRKADGSYHGYACPRCGFGPIDRKACSDLTAHHHQRMGVNRISNKCPLCFFFADDISRWKVWDGTFLTPQQIADLRNERQQATMSIEQQLGEAQEELRKSAQLKARFKAASSMSFHTLLMAQLRGVEDQQQADDGDVIDLDNLDLDTIPEMVALDGMEDPSELRIQMNMCTDAEEFQDLSNRLQKALLQSRNTGGGKVMRIFSKINQRTNYARSCAWGLEDRFEETISKRMTELYA